jgi:hypothetical protein
MSAFYQSFLLRLRRVNNAGRPVWRFSVESPASPENLHFQNLDELCAFLLDCIQEAEEIERHHLVLPGDDR